MEPEDVTFELLREITHDFSEERKLGEGTFGVVYKGLTKNGEHVAVKKLRNNGIDLDHHKQFQNELHNLTKLKHKNIVRLFGYCYQIETKPMDYNGTKVLCEQTYRALCLEYLHEGSLQNYLSDEFSGLDWHTRYEIMKGICEGLKHIHKELEKPLYHLDLKPANILLDENMVPKLADFGLSRICSEELTVTPQTTKSPIGTHGYQPPEYIDRGEISEKFDIFSLGVVIIKIVSGPERYKKCADMRGQEFIDLVKTNWRNRLQKEKCSDSLLEEYCQQVETCTQIALKCVEEDSQKRPDMEKIIDKLNGCKHPQKGSQMRLEPNDSTDQKQHSNLMTSSRCTEVEFVDTRETSSNVGEEYIVGRTEEKSKIMAKLKNSMTQRIIILPIYGIGGIGKTTFARLVYNDTNFKNYSRVWVYVSPRFDLNKISNSIISQLPKKESQIIEIEMIHKKILIVLDDLWEDNLFELKELKDLLNTYDSINTTVLVTTRSEHVAKNISTNTEAYKMKSLTDDMCWDIIKQRSGFEARNDKEHLACVGREIAVKCGGVALAAQSLGFMLHSMESRQWMEVKDSALWNESISKDSTLPNHVLASLKLSCTKMGPCLMSCFTYCAIFPKGHQIIKENLIYQWISLGFIKPTILRSSLQLGEDYIVQLLGLSFLQHLETHKNSDEGLTVFTMHDLVNDLARSLVVDEILDESNTGGRDYRYACLAQYCEPLESLTYSPDTIKVIHLPIRFWKRHVRFAASDEAWLYSNLSLEAYLCAILSDEAYLSAKHLQVLDLSVSRQNDLPASVGELLELRYLNAPGIKGNKLPDSLTKLSGLIYLNLHGSSISALPDSVGEIKGLMHLDISGCLCMHELPKSFVNLKNLVHLNLSDCSVRITAEAFWGLTSIQHLNLSCRSKDFPESTGFEGMQEVISNLIELRYLDLSGYSWRANWTLQPDEILSFVDRICTLTNLEHLDLSRNVQLVSFPERIGSLRKLRRLDLSGCSKLVTLPECMRKMDSLKFINVTSCFHLDMSMVPQYKFASLPHFVVLADYFESTSSNIGLLRHENPNILHISKLENVMSAEEVYRIKLSEKAVKSLTLEWTVDYWRSMEDMEVLGMLVPPNTLKYFELRGYSSVSFPTWVMGIELYLANLTKVVLWELHKCISLPPLGQLPRLGELVIGRMDSITTIEEGFCSAGPGAFRQLMRFHLRQMENLEVWNTTYYVQDDVQEFMFPNLEELLICDCPKLRLKPCAPTTREWEIENSDNVLSSWDGEGEIDPDALLSPPQEKYREPGGSYRATPRVLKVKSSKVPFEQWRLFRHLLPTYTLSITCCTYLTSNSQEIIRELSSIKLLYLEDDAQPQLPKWLGELTSLERLGITKYLGLDAPLESMKQLTCLRYLWLSNCGSMPTLPQWLGELISLRRLTISDWRNLSDFPESMRRLTSLQEMRLEGCPRITALPEWLGDLASLNKLLINCEGIEYLPASIQKLTKLEKLTIYAPKLAQWCASLENKRKLAHIKKKDIYRFNNKYGEGKLQDDSFFIEDQKEFYRRGTDFLQV